jgi:hypothetical protein
MNDPGMGRLVSRSIAGTGVGARGVALRPREGDPMGSKNEFSSPNVDPIMRLKSRRKLSINDLTSFFPSATSQHSVAVVSCLVVGSDSLTTSMGIGGDGGRGEIKGLLRGGDAGWNKL